MKQPKQVKNKTQEYQEYVYCSNCGKGGFVIGKIIRGKFYGTHRFCGYFGKFTTL